MRGRNKRVQNQGVFGVVGVNLGLRVVRKAFVCIMLNLCVDIKLTVS